MAFLAACVEFIKPTVNGKEFSTSSIKVLWRTLITVLQFKHRDFRDNYKGHDMIRINEFVEQSTIAG